MTIDIYTLIFMAVAIFVLVRLRNVLGRRTGSERPPFDPYSRRQTTGQAETGEKVIDLPRPAPAPVGGAEEGGPATHGVEAVTAVDRGFNMDQFLQGARAAYEMIVTSFAEGERKTLKQLLSREVYDGFISAITDRESRGETIEFKFVGIDKAEPTDVTVRGGIAQITVRFVSSLTSVTRDSSGNVIDGNPTQVNEVTDIWTFARDTRSKDPNWRLVATESVE